MISSMTTSEKLAAKDPHKSCLRRRRASLRTPLGLSKAGDVRGEIGSHERDARITGTLMDTRRRGAQGSSRCVAHCRGSWRSRSACSSNTRSISCLRFDQEEVGESEAIGARAKERMEFLVHFGPGAAILGIPHQALVIDCQEWLCPRCTRTGGRSRQMLSPRRNVQGHRREHRGLPRDEARTPRDRTCRDQPPPRTSRSSGSTWLELVIGCRELLHAVDSRSAYGAHGLQRRAQHCRR